MEGTTVLIEAETRSKREKMSDAYDTIQRAMLTARRACRTAEDSELLKEVEKVLVKARSKGDELWLFA